MTQPKSKCNSRISRLLVGLLALAAPLAHAGDDSCDDYYKRHNKADLTASAVSVTNIARVHDIPAYQNLAVTIRNVGNLRIGELDTSPVPHANEIAVDVKGRRFIGALPAPLEAGGATTVNFLVPAKFFANCETIAVRIDATRAAGQFGCNCYANDDASFRFVQIVGREACFHVIPRPPLPHPGR